MVLNGWLIINRHVEFAALLVICAIWVLEHALRVCRLVLQDVDCCFPRNISYLSCVDSMDTFRWMRLEGLTIHSAASP